MILCGIVAGSEVDGTIEFAAHDFEGHCGRGRECVAEQGSNAVVPQNVHGELGEFLGVEARVMAHQNRGLFRLSFRVFRNGGDCQANIRKGEIVGDQTTPSRGAKLNGGGRP